MRILISGTGGFVGSNLLPHLNLKFPDVEIIPLVSKPRGIKNEVTWEQLHGLDKNNIDIVIHLAGLAHDTKNTHDEDAYYKVNYELTSKLYEWYLDSSANKFIYLSSVKAVADSVDGVLDENVQPTPLTPYGKSKLKAEENIIRSSDKPDDKKYYVLRPCMIHGPNNKGNLNLLYQFVKKGYPYPLGAYDNKRSFLSIENLLFAIGELITRDITSGVYHIADDSALAVSNLFSVIASSIGKKERVFNVPKWVIEPIANIGTLLKLPLNAEKLNKLTENYIVSNEKLKKALNIEVLPVSAEEGIRKTILSFEHK